MGVVKWVGASGRRSVSDETWPPAGYVMRGNQLTPVWTPRGFAERGDAFFVACSCGRRVALDCVGLVEAGRGDTPMHEIARRLTCSGCGGREFKSELGEPRRKRP